MYRSYLASLVTLSLVGSFFAPLAAEAAPRPTPAKVLEAIVNQPTAELTAFTGAVVVESKVTAPKKKNTKKSNSNLYYYPPTDSKFGFEFSGYNDLRDPTIDKSFGSISLQLATDLFGGKPKPVAGNYMFIDKTIYFQYPDKEFFTAEVAQEFQKHVPGVVVSEQSWFKYDLSDIWKELESLREKAKGLPDQVDEITPAEEEKIKKAFLKSGVVSLRFVKEEVMQGVPVYTYTVGIKKAGVLPFLREVSQIVDGKKMSKEEEKEFVDMLKDFKTLPTISISVQKSDLKLAHFAAKLSQKETDKEGYVTVGTFSLVVHASYPDAIPSIVEPPDTINLRTLYESYSNSYSNTSWGAGIYESIQPKPSVNDSYRVGDLRRLQTALELYYTDHNMYPDGSNVLLGSSEYRCLNIDGWKPIGCTMPYLSKVYKDPGVLEYRYTSLNNGKSYQVDAELEGIASGLHDKIILTPAGLTQR